MFPQVLGDDPLGTLDLLLKYMPTEEEAGLLNRFKGDVSKLGRCEQFFLEVCEDIHATATTRRRW
jgi:hypothetical protein